MNKCEKCKEEFEGQSWQKICRKCFAKSKSNVQSENPAASIDESRKIVKQVLYKCSAQILPQGTSAQELIAYAKKLEQGFYE